MTRSSSAEAADGPLVEEMQRRSRGSLSELIGIELTRAEQGRVTGRLVLREHLLAPHGFVHAGTLVSFADHCAGMGCVASLPAGMGGFTTVELKANFVRTSRLPATLTCVARLAHSGRRLQVWDATVSRDDDGAALALFRCTQTLLSQNGTDPRGAVVAAPDDQGVFS